MDRRYYRLKAGIIGAAFAAAIIGGGFECSQLEVARHSNYQAAFIAQSALRDASVSLGRSIRTFFSRAYADL
jgi:hypothetical protein